jgi:hypothetical protein
MLGDKCKKKAKLGLGIASLLCTHNVRSTHLFQEFQLSRRISASAENIQPFHHSLILRNFQVEFSDLFP